jgi:hypothetical protein
VLIITKNGKPVAEVRPKTDLIDPARQEAIDRMVEGMKRGIPGLSGPATYEERTE